MLRVKKNIVISKRMLGLYRLERIFFLILFYLPLQCCIGFAIYKNESATGIHVGELTQAGRMLQILPTTLLLLQGPRYSNLVHAKSFSEV